MTPDRPEFTLVLDDGWNEPDPVCEWCRRPDPYYNCP